MPVPPVVTNEQADGVEDDVNTKPTQNKRPTMVLVLGVLNCLLLLVIAGFLTYDYVTMVMQDASTPFNSIKFFVSGIALLLFYAVPITLQIGFFQGKQLTWVIYRFFGGVLSISGLLMICFMVFGQKNWGPRGSYTAIMLSSFLVTYLWLDTKTARTYFGINLSKLLL